MNRTEISAWIELGGLSRPISSLDRFLPRLRYPQGTSISASDFKTCAENYAQISEVAFSILERETGIPCHRSPL